MKIILIVFLFLISCAKPQIKPDPSVTPMDANYPTAEFTACGNLWHGLGVCFLKKGQSISDVNLEIQGYYKGNVKVTSSCGFNENKRYEDNQKIKVQSSMAAEPCIVSFVVSPEYPNEKKAPVVVRSIDGHLAISVIEDGEDYFGYTSKIKEGMDDSIYIDADQGTRRVVFKGCGHSFDKQIDSVGGLVEISARDILGGVSATKCALSGGISNDKVKYITWLIWGYSSGFQPLSNPMVKIKGSKITISADPVVSVVSVGSGFKVGNMGTFKIDPEKSYIVRAITSNGRTAIGLYKDGGVTWLK